MPIFEPHNDSPFIEVPRLSRIFDNTTATYKYYWFVSIINHILDEPERDVFSFYDIISGMIAEAWYPIHYFRISFGKSDSLEAKIIEIQSVLQIPIDERKSKVAETILANIGNPAVRRCLNIFTLNVPYRFLSPWIPNATDKQVESLSQQFFNNCPYAISEKTIFIPEIWRKFIIEHSTILKDFTFWNLSSFLQRRNPNVPDIPSKLVKPLQRVPLTKQKRFWDRYILASDGVSCIYTGQHLQKGMYDLDHFIPWSFVAHDLNWNLLPSCPSINSSKSDHLPPLDKYLLPLSTIQQKALEYNITVAPRDPVLEDYISFKLTYDELIHLPSDQFFTLFKNEFTPLVQTAQNMGFSPWINIPTYE